MAPLADPSDLTALIPETRAWNEGRGIAPEDWIACVGRYELAIGYGLLFWPRFVRFERYVLRKGFSEASLRGFERATGGDRQAVEAVMNHVHIVDIHSSAPEPTEMQIRHLGRLLTDIHAVKLARDFPDLRVQTSFPDEAGLDPADYAVSVWQMD